MSLINFSTFKEHAKRAQFGRTGDVSRMPLTIDKDDLRYLNQFETEFWAQAIVKRYEKLWDALVSLHEKRLKIIEDEKLNRRVEEYLRGYKSDIPNKIKDEVEKEGIKIPLDEDEAKEQAKSFAFYYVKEETDLGHLQDRKEEIKISPSTGRGRKPKDHKIQSFNVNLYLNSLYHKLERTRGLKHFDDKMHDLSGVGEYGYDLSHPTVTKEGSKSKRTTVGTEFEALLNLESWKKAVDKFLHHSSHGHFGIRTKGFLGNEVKWMEVKSHGSRVLKDPTYQWIFEESKKKLMDSKLKEAYGSEEYKNLSKKGIKETIEEQVEEELKIKLAEVIKRGELHAPFVPGVDDNERYYKIDDDGEIIAPNLMLPHINEDGKWKPLLNPSRYLKRLSPTMNTIEGPDQNPDHVEGLKNKKDVLEKATGKAQKLFHDYENDLLHSIWTSFNVSYGDMHWGKNNSLSSFGPHIGQNVRSSNYLDPSSSQGKSVWNNLVSSFNERNVVPEFEAAIVKCSKSSSCGGAPEEIRTPFLRDLDVRYSACVALLMQTKEGLGDTKLNQEPDEKGFNWGWFEWASNKFSSWMQYPSSPPLSTSHGEGHTRRKRSVVRSIAQSNDDGSQYDPGEGENSFSSVKRGRGDKIFGTITTSIKDVREKALKRLNDRKRNDASKSRSSNQDSAGGNLRKTLEASIQDNKFFQELERILPGIVGKEEADRLVKQWQPEGDETIDYKRILQNLANLNVISAEAPKAPPSISPVVKPTIPSTAVKAPLASRLKSSGGTSPLLSRIKKSNEEEPKPEALEWTTLSINERVEHFKHLLRS